MSLSDPALMKQYADAGPIEESIDLPVGMNVGL
jgi:hypothetical protein